MQSNDLKDVKEVLTGLKNDPEIKNLIDEFWQLIKNVIYNIANSTLDGLINLSEKKAKLYGTMLKHLTKQGFTKQEAIELILRENQITNEQFKSFLTGFSEQNKTSVYNKQVMDLYKNFSRVYDLLEKLSNANVALTQRLAVIERIIQANKSLQ